MIIPVTTEIFIAPGLIARFARMGAPPLNQETRGILDRHRRAAKRRAGGADFCTHSRVLFADGEPGEIITATRPKPEAPDLLTIMCLATEWEAITGEGRHACPGAGN
jgi:hypothetical protein